MPGHDARMTTDELSQHLRQSFTAEGKWNFPAVREFSSNVWQTWIEARLRGKAPWVPYARDEYPGTAAFLFVDYVRQAGRQRVDTGNCCQGAADFLASLDPDQKAGEQSHLLKNALELVGHLRARCDQAFHTLRDWITPHRLLDRSDWPIELHRAALNALAALQKRGVRDDESIWQAWVQPWTPANQKQKYVFVPAAFSGLAMGRTTVPADELRLLLRYYREMQAQGVRLPISGAILSLWVDRESDEVAVRNELWEAVQHSAAPQADWETVRRCADRLYPVKPWEQMRSLCARQAHAVPGCSGLWCLDALVRPRLALQPT